jgi:thioredoxin-like negative regulator of GroEL
MEARYYLTCLWPGLAELWWRGRLSAIPTAMAFAVALNLLLVTRYLYPEWLSSGLVTMAFWVGIVVWGFCVIRSVRELPLLISPRRVSDDPDRFPEAHAAYLRGEWREAEKLLTEVLAIEPRDPPALLLLAGIYRQTDRLEAAELLLSEIRRLEVADHWWLEVDAETRRWQRAKQSRDEKLAAKEAPAAADMTENRPLAA